MRVTGIKPVASILQSYEKCRGTAAIAAFITFAAMEQTTISLIIAIIAFLVAMYAFFLISDLRKKTPAGGEQFSSRPLILQAYERLVIFAERISIPSIVSRASQQGVPDARSMQMLLLESIKQEFEYNSSQQIYVSPVAWQAVNNLKEQNMLIINQIAQTLPADARGYDLGKRIMEVIIAQDKKALHNIVLEALNFEARKLMK